MGLSHIALPGIPSVRTDPIGYRIHIQQLPAPEALLIHCFSIDRAAISRSKSWRAIADTAATPYFHDLDRRLGVLVRNSYQIISAYLRMELIPRTIKTAKPAAAPPTHTICRAPKRPFRTLCLPRHPLTIPVLTQPKTKRAKTIIPMLYQRPRRTLSFGTARYGMRGMRPPKK